MNIKNFLEHLHTPETYWYFHSNKSDIYCYVKELKIMLTLSSPTPDAISIIIEEQANSNTKKQNEKRAYTLPREEIQDYLNTVFTNMKERAFIQSTYKSEIVQDTYRLVCDYLMTGNLPTDFIIQKEKNHDIEDIILIKEQQKIYIRIGNAASNFNKEIPSALQSLKIGIVEKKEEGVYFEVLIPRYEIEKSAILAPAFNLQMSANTQEQFIESLLTFEDQEVKSGMHKTILEVKLNDKSKPDSRKFKI